MYELAADLVTTLSESKIDMEMLLQLDKLVQLLESPIFMSAFSPSLHYFVMNNLILLIIPLAL
jgi:hypothetical protein